MLFNRQREREEWVGTLKVGDKVAIRSGRYGYSAWRIHEVVKVTPSGRKNLNNGTILNPDGSLRGDKYNYAHPVTNEIRRAIWRKRAEGTVSRMNIRTLSDSQLKRIEEILEEGKE
ncbi:hypothetical protein ACW5UC_24755 [Priestia aryabhattai]|uniref:hypothetical protein n=1 Tax=Priestia megaterium TaxID=1404 RepID=UPI003F95973D